MNVSASDPPTADGRVRVLKTAGLSNGDLWKKFQLGGCNEDDFSGYDAFAGEVRVNWANIAALAVWLLSVAAMLTLAVRGRKPMKVASSSAAN